MAVSISAVALNAAGALERTHAFGERGPRTFMARQRVATWLDTGRGSLRKVRADIAWLNEVVKRESQR